MKRNCSIPEFILVSMVTIVMVGILSIVFAERTYAMQLSEPKLLGAVMSDTQANPLTFSVQNALASSAKNKYYDFGKKRTLCVFM